MFLNRIQPVRQLNNRATNYAFRAGSRLHNFPIEEFPAGAFTVVVAALGGLIAWWTGAPLMPLLHLDSPNLLGAWVVLGIVCGIAGAIKLMVWLNDRIHNDTRRNRG